MNKLHSLLIIIPFIVGCSSNPETSDIKRILKNQFDGCKNIDIESVKKINGIKRSEYEHEVQYSYKIKLINDDIDEIAEEFNKYYDSRKNWQNWDFNKRKELDVIHNQISQYIKDQIGQKPTFDWKAAYEWEQNKSKLWKEHPKSEEYSSLINSKGPEILPEPRKSENSTIQEYLLEGCKNSKANGIIFPIIMSLSKNGKFPLSSDSELTMEGSMILRKTDNGWENLR